MREDEYIDIQIEKELLEQARRKAESEGKSVEDFIIEAVIEKIDG